VDGRGVRERAGEALRFTALLAPEGTLRTAAVYVQAALRNVGVAMEIQPLDMRLVRARVRNGDFDAVFFPFWNHVDSHLQWLGEGPGYRPDDPQAARLPGYHNPEVSRLLWAVKETSDQDVIDSIYRELAPLVLADFPITFLFPQTDAVVAHRRVRGLESPYRADPMRYMERLWIEEGR